MVPEAQNGNGRDMDLVILLTVPIYFNSPTYSNGAALVLSDGVTTAINTDLLTPAINCTGQDYVALQFYQFFDVYNSATAQVFVSNDSINWTMVFDAFQDVLNNGGHEPNPERLQFDISAYAANQPKVWIKWNYQATDDRWWALDDIRVFTLPANDVAVDSVVIPNYAGISNGGSVVQATIENLGGATLNSVQLSYVVDGGTPITQTFGTLGMSPFTTETLQFTTQANFDSVKSYNVTITSTLPNGGTDANTANDAASRKIVGISQIPNRNVLLECFSTAICGYCPELGTWLEQMLATVDSTYLIPVCIHAGFGTDAMTTNEADTLSGDLDLQGAPSVSVNRELYYGNLGITVTPDNLGYPDNIPPLEEAEYGVVSPVSISATNNYNPDTRALSVTVNTVFYGPVTGDFRMNCYIIEDSVVGGGAGYNQHSYYYNSPAADENPWYRVGHIHQATDMLLLRDLFITMLSVN